MAGRFLFRSCFVVLVWTVTVEAASRTSSGLKRPQMPRDCSFVAASVSREVGIPI